jgi:predicted phosphodiesterase
MRQSARRRIGLISDIHGLLRPEALAFLHGCSAIIHAGDIGGPPILDDLRCIAPVTAVRGNNDDAPLAESLRHTELIRVNRVLVFEGERTDRRPGWFGRGALARSEPPRCCRNTR